MYWWNLLNEMKLLITVQSLKHKALSFIIQSVKKMIKQCCCQNVLYGIVKIEIYWKAKAKGI